MKSNQINTFKSLLHKLIKEELESGEGDEKPAGLEKVNYDLEYMKKKSLFFDIFILYKTIFKVLNSQNIKH